MGKKGDKLYFPLAGLQSQSLIRVANRKWLMNSYRLAFIPYWQIHPQLPLLRGSRLQFFSIAFLSSPFLHRSYSNIARISSLRGKVAVRYVIVFQREQATLIYPDRAAVSCGFSASVFHSFRYSEGQLGNCKWSQTSYILILFVTFQYAYSFVRQWNRPIIDTNISRPMTEMSLSLMVYLE